LNWARKFGEVRSAGCRVTGAAVEVAAAAAGAADAVGKRETIWGTYPPLLSDR
jgi:hypothetical protein